MDGARGSMTEEVCCRLMITSRALRMQPNGRAALQPLLGFSIESRAAKIEKAVNMGATLHYMVLRNSTAILSTLHDATTDRTTQFISLLHPCSFDRRFDD